MARECTVASAAIQVDWIKVDGTLVALGGSVVTSSNHVDVEVGYSGRITCNSIPASGGGCQACAYWGIADSNDPGLYRYAKTIGAACGNFDTFTFTNHFNIGYGIGVTYYQGMNTEETWNFLGAVYGEYEGFEGFYCRDTPELSGNSIAACSEQLTITLVFDIGP